MMQCNTVGDNVVYTYLVLRVGLAGPTVWNNLPVDITNVPLLRSFKKRLRAYVLTLNN